MDTPWNSLRKEYGMPPMGEDYPTPNANQAQAEASTQQEIKPWEALQPLDQRIADTKPFFERVYGDLEERGRKLGIQEAKLLKGEVTPLEGIVNIANHGVAGPLLDIIGEGVTSAVGEAGDLVSGAIDDPVWRGWRLKVPENLSGDVKAKIKDGLDYILNTDAGKYAMTTLGDAVKTGQEKWDTYKKENPRDAELVESIFNVSMMFAPAKTKANAKPSKLGQIGEDLIKSGTTKSVAERRTFLEKLITPAHDKAVAEDLVTRKVSVGDVNIGGMQINPLQYYEHAPTARENQIINILEKIPELKRSPDLQKSYQIIYNNRELERIDFERLLKAYNSTVVNPSTIDARINSAITRVVLQNPTLSSDPALMRVARTVAKHARDAIRANKNNPMGLLQARRDLDKIIENNKKRIFETDQMSAQRAALDEIRKEMNQAVIDALPASARPTAEASLRKQHLMHVAQDIVQTKAANQSNYAIGRAWQNVVRVLPLREKVLGALASVSFTSILGASQWAAPWFSGLAAGTAVTAVGGKIIFAPGGRKLVGTLIRAMDQAIPIATNPEMAIQLKKDRAILIGLYKTTKEPSPEEQYKAENKDKIKDEQFDSALKKRLSN